MLMNYHIGRLVLSSLCVGAFGAGDFWWCSFCRLKLHSSTIAMMHGPINIRYATSGFEGVIDTDTQTSTTAVYYLNPVAATCFGSYQVIL